MMFNNYNFKFVNIENYVPADENFVFENVCTKYKYLFGYSSWPFRLLFNSNIAQYTNIG